MELNWNNMGRDWQGGPQLTELDQDQLQATQIDQDSLKKTKMEKGGFVLDFWQLLQIIQVQFI